MHYYSMLETILQSKQVDEKFEKFEDFYKNFLDKNLSYETNYVPIELKEPSYSSFLKIQNSKSAKSRKYFDTKEGKAILLHTIAHIEYSAIDLALDASLRFQGLPDDYYEDWLEVASDEIRHFKMINELLEELGYKYGDFVVHSNLFEAMKKTENIQERMAVVPRYLEANGLDQNPKIMEKLKSNPDSFNKKIIKALETILEEEIEHVRKGDKWFKFICEKENLESQKEYLRIIEKFYPNSMKQKKELNFKARKEAGFSCEELKILANKANCS